MVKEKKVLVVGLGRTGIAAANRLCAMGAKITVTDSQDENKLKESLAQLDSGIEVAVGGHKGVAEKKFDFVVTSPGIDWESELLKNFRDSGVEVISEMELAYRLSPAKWIAVTGTNGKTTTTSLVGEMLKAANIGTVVCGNIGNPAIGEDAVFEKDNTVVAEVSSFQLEGMASFAPFVAAVLNIAPDHLDRHGSMEKYSRIKGMVFARQSSDDICVLNMDDPLTAALADSAPSKIFGFSADKALTDGAFVDNGKIMVSRQGKSSVIGEVSGLKIIGRPNLENALAACAVAVAAGSDSVAVEKALFAFKGIEHRMEIIAEHEGVRYINDSKGTNVSATLKALEGIDVPVTLIMGGRDKEGDFSPLAELIRKKETAVILIGEAAQKIADSLSGYEKIKRAQTVEESVKIAASSARSGDTVLLSPACASFDMFKNYMERGECFRKAVLNLKSNQGAMNA